ncbi:MAG: hypothetical protein J5504_04800 [Butyrivibrio sp.]|nr:hypothetical protein [Butyrivibrio sp.]
MSRRYTLSDYRAENYSDKDMLDWLDGMEYKNMKELAAKIVKWYGMRKVEKNHEELSKAIDNLEKEGLIEKYMVNGKTAFRITNEGKDFVYKHHNDGASDSINPLIVDINKEKERKITERVMQTYKKKEARDELLNACSKLQFILTSKDADNLSKAEFDDIRKLLKEIVEKEIELRKQFGVEPTA